MFSYVKYNKINNNIENIIEMETNEKLTNSLNSSNSNNLNRISLNYDERISNNLNLNNLILYYFKPFKIVPKLRLFDGKTLNSSLKAIISKNTLLIIIQSDEKWNYIITGEIEGWCQLNLNDINIKTALLPIITYRKYLEWKGNNTFLFNGNLMFGSDFKFFIGTNILYIIPTIFYFSVVAPYMYLPELTIIIMAILFLYSMINLWFAATTDPGIIPRNPSYVTVSY